MPKRRYSVKEEVLDVDDDLRCRRSDGRKWRCRRRAMPGVTFCEYHHLRTKSNSELLQRNRSSDNEKNGKTTTSATETLSAGRKKRKKKMKLIEWVVDADSDGENLNLMQRRDSELQEFGRSSDSMGENSDPEEAVEELLRMAIKRQMERRERREKRMEREKESEVRMNLPNGVMAISSSPVMVSRNAGDMVDRKIGLGFGGDDFLLRRCFRSKNVEPAPLGPVKKLPRDLGRRQRKVCDKCGEERSTPQPIRNDYLHLWFWLKSILKTWQSCKTCCMHRGAIDSGSKGKLGRTRYAPYFICQKLPIQQLNWEQMSELEIEASNQGRKLSGVQLEVAEYGHDEQLKCNSCRISIGDLHRSCSKCCYKLCLSCCQEIRKGSLLSGVTSVSCRYLNGTKAYKNVGKTADGVKNKFDNMSCPPSEHGGCSDGILNMKFLVPFDWRRRPDT